MRLQSNFRMIIDFHTNVILFPVQNTDDNSDQKNSNHSE